MVKKLVGVERSNMDYSLFSLNEPQLFEPIKSENNVYMDDKELTEIIEELEIIENIEDLHENDLEELQTDLPDQLQPDVELPGDVLTNEVFMQGINQLVNTIDPYSVDSEVPYVDSGTFFNIGVELPDYAVVYSCNGYEVVFPTEYTDQVFVSDGMLINLGGNYTVGTTLDGYSVNNYLSSEITIPTYHSSTWYQYMQTYGQPYRIVDRYINDRGTITSMTRERVNVEWSGGNPWAGFTFDRIALFGIIAILSIMLIFRRSKV